MLIHLALLALASTIGAVWLQSSAASRVVLRQAWAQAPSGVTSGAVSADGRHVAFVSFSRLLPADTNNLEDIYVLDRWSRRLTLETLASGGRAADGSALHPHLSADGRYVVFDSLATDMTEGDRSDCVDVFVRDRLLGTIARISVGLNREDANGRSGSPTVGDDGQVVAFESHATNLVAGEDENGTAVDVYVASPATGAIARAGVDGHGHQFGQSYAARLSGDGRYVVFAAKPRLPRGDGRDAQAVGTPSVYLRDLVAGTTICVSCDRAGRPGVAAFAPDISGDGSVVAFAVQTAPRRSDVVVHDRVDGSSVVVTRRANAGSAAPRLSRDGRTVAFESLASDLLCERRCPDDTLDENVLPDVYLYERGSRTFRRASGARRTWWAPSVAPAIDGRGQVVIFSSREPFGPEDVTADFDLFVCAPVCP
jgi:Tol biopolymer transport system component